MLGRVQMFGGHPRRLSRSNSVSVISAEGLYKKGNRPESINVNYPGIYHHCNLYIAFHLPLNGMTG